MSRLEQRAWSAQGRALREVPCNLCGSDDARVLAVENDLDVKRCRRCGLIYVSPQPTSAELLRFYAEYYVEESEDLWREVMLAHFARDAERLEACLGGPGRVLDVGTGFGHFPDLLRRRGWDVAAVESSPVAARRLRERGIPVFEGQVPGVELPGESFDAATLESVLEHVADPLAVLRATWQALRPGGVVLVRVPNVQLLSLFFVAARFRNVGGVRALLRVVRRDMMDEDNLFSVIDPPGHLFGFAQGTLRAALECAGFARVESVADPMHRRGTRVNAWIDGVVFAVAEGLRRASRGRLVLAPNLVAIARRPGDTAQLVPVSKRSE